MRQPPVQLGLFGGFAPLDVTALTRKHGDQRDQHADGRVVDGGLMICAAAQPIRPNTMRQ